MRPDSLLSPAYCLALTLPCAQALHLQKPRDAAPRVVQFGFQRNEIRDKLAHDRNRLARRDKSLSITLDNDELLYSLNISLGTPAQDFIVAVDTGSSDLWVNADSSSLCKRKSKPCEASGTYNANSSSTYNFVGDWFNVSYVDGSGASGDYVTDTLRVEGQTVKDFQFGVGYESSSSLGIMGIGYPSDEAQVSDAGQGSYRNLPAQLAHDGTIQSSAYSLWLDDLESNTGTLLFGGVDHAKYNGDLVTVPILRAQGSPYTAFYVALNNLQIDGQDVGQEGKVAVVLDSGTSFTYLPSDVVSSIYDAVGAVYSESEGAALVPCSLADQNANLTFYFDSPARIDVPMSELVLGATGQDQSAGDGQVQACQFGIIPSSGQDAPSLLGDTFLRSAYVVFDLDNNEISLAQSNTNAGKSDISEIGTGDNAVPSAVQATGTSGTDTGSGAPQVPSSTSTGSSDNQDDGVGVLRPCLGSVLASLAIAGLGLLV